jgi:hypothetical protein
MIPIFNMRLRLPSGSANRYGLTTDNAADAGFDLLETLNATDLTDIAATTAVSLRKFTVPFQGGFDGQNPAVVRSVGGNITSTNTQGFDLSDSPSLVLVRITKLFKRLQILKHTISTCLVLPGVIYSQHTYVITQGLDMVNRVVIVSSRLMLIFLVLPLILQSTPCRIGFELCRNLSPMD